VSSPPATGGIGTYAREIAAAATALGAEVTVAAPDYASDNRALDGRCLTKSGGFAADCTR
jgi:hypothetical protein